MRHAVAILTVPSSPPTRQATKEEVRGFAGMFLIVLVLCVTMLIGSLLMLRARTRRAHVARALGVEERRPPSRSSVIDPWSESARRLEVGPDDHDTVDIDPRDLGPDDIEPRNGKGVP